MDVCPHHEGNHFTCCIDFYEYCVAARNPLYRDAVQCSAIGKYSI